MRRWNDFRGGLTFAAVAAVGVVPFAATAGPVLGWTGALTAYAVCAVAAHAFGLAGSVRAGIPAAALAGAVAAIAALVAPTLADAVAGAALATGLCRSGLLYRSRFARALGVESALALSAVGLAGHVYTGTLLSAALATWAFFLVQSAFFLVGGVAPRRPATAASDPFDAARDRAVEILEMGEPAP